MKGRTDRCSPEVVVIHTWGGFEPGGGYTALRYLLGYTAILAWVHCAAILACFAMLAGLL